MNAQLTAADDNVIAFPRSAQHYPFLDLSFVGQVPAFRHPWHPERYPSTTSSWAVDATGLSDPAAWRMGRDIALESYDRNWVMAV